MDFIVGREYAAWDPNFPGCVDITEFERNVEDYWGPVHQFRYVKSRTTCQFSTSYILNDGVQFELIESEYHKLAIILKAEYIEE